MSFDEALREQFRAVLRAELPAALAEALEAAKPPAERLANREECARFLGISPRSLDTLRLQGLPTLWVLESPRFDLHDIRAWIASRKAQP